MNKEIYRVTVEVKHMEGTTLPDDFLGAIVNVYLPAFNIREALDLAEEYLLTDKYKPVDIFSAYQVEIDDDEIESDDEEAPSRQDFINLLNNGGYWYGPFHSWSGVEDNEKH